ncbi:MAG: LacI family DNA-binding transcriptional regulator [Candidatus Dormibacteria bacterium]
MKNPTIYEIANHAGVSIASVSRVLNNLPGVSEATGRRILESARELGYVPNGAARGLAQGTHRVIGLVFRDLDDQTCESGHETLLYSDEVIRGAERAARAAGYAVMIVATHRSTGRDLLMSVAGKVDGLVVLARSVSESDLKVLALHGPVALLAVGHGVKGVDDVAADNEGGSAAVTSHLAVRHGYTDIAFLSGPLASPDSRARFAGHQQAMEAVGLTRPERPTLVGDFTEESGARAIRELLQRPTPLPQAIVSANDQMAVGALTALSKAGLSVPNDVALTGFDDIQLASYVAPALTTVRQPMRQLGAECVRLVVDRLAHPRVRSTEVVLPTQLIVRGSCGCRSQLAGGLEVPPTGSLPARGGAAGGSMYRPGEPAQERRHAA